MIYIFGGEKLYDEHTHTRECFNEIRSFNTETLEWRLIKSSGDGIEGRRGHACAVVGKNMLIFGGVNSKGFYLDSLYHLDLSIILSDKYPRSIKTIESISCRRRIVH
jgi:N-acetylneuraminic acid mutarotase